MVDTYKPPFGTYTSVQAIAGALETELIDNIQSLGALFGIVISQTGTTITYTDNATVPDFNKISDGMRKKLAAELQALILAVIAAP